MSADLFTGVSAGRSGAEGESSGSGFSRVERTEEVDGGWGAAPRRFKARYPFDVTEAQARVGPAVKVSDNSKLSRDEFLAATSALLMRAGMEDEMSERQLAFMHAIYYAHAVNSASQRAPGRATFKLEGHASTFNYHIDVIVPLGDNARRYFRAAADEIRCLLYDLFRRRAVLSDDELEIALSVEARAEERGLHRFPWCAFDAADGMTSEASTFPERTAVAASKAGLLPAVGNEFDVVRPHRGMEAAVAGGIRHGSNGSPSQVSGGYQV